MRGVVYLAGPISGLTYEECTLWRERAASRLRLSGILPRDPMRGKEHLKDRKGLLPSVPVGLPDPLCTPRGIISRDFNDVKQADVVLANFLGARQVSIGTCIEVGWAKAMQKPVVLVMEEQGNLNDHPFVTEPAAYRVTDLQEGLDLVESLLGV